MEQDINAWWNSQVKNFNDSDYKRKRIISFRDTTRKNLAFEMNCKDYEELKNTWQYLNEKYTKFKKGIKVKDELEKNAQKFFKTYNFTYTVKALQIKQSVEEIINNVNIDQINEDIMNELLLAASLGHVIFRELLDLDIYFHMELIYDDEDFFFEEEKYYTLCDNLVREYIDKTEMLLKELKHYDKIQDVIKRVLK